MPASTSLIPLENFCLLSLFMGHECTVSTAKGYTSSTCPQSQCQQSRGQTTFSKKAFLNRKAPQEKVL